jgi:hypothetical protein
MTLALWDEAVAEAKKQMGVKDEFVRIEGKLLKKCQIIYTMLMAKS